MTKAQIAGRRKAVASALGSVRAEGLKPSTKTRKQLQQYADGKITAKELHKTTLWEVKRSVKTGKWSAK